MTSYRSQKLVLDIVLHAKHKSEVTNLESARSTVESAEIEQAASEFDALSQVVIGELRKALRGASSFLDVQVAAGSAWTDPVQLRRRGDRLRMADEPSGMRARASPRVEQPSPTGRVVAR